MPKGVPITQAAIDRAREMRELGASNGAIARELGLSHTAIGRLFGFDGDRSGVSQAQVDARRERYERAKEMIDAGVPYHRVARSLGMTDTTLRRWFGPSPVQRGETMQDRHRERLRKSEERQYELAKMRREGLTNAQIAERTGLTIGAVYQRLGATPRRLGGWKMHDPAMHERVWFLRECGNTIDEISEKTGVPRSTVGDWVRGLPCE